MAITYHAGRRVQGLSGTTTTVTTSKITNTNGSNNSNGFSQITGIIGNALQQSGGGNYNLGSTIILNPSATNGWSVNMWVKIPTPSGNQYWLQFNSDTVANQRSIFYMYKHSTDGLVPNFYDGTGQKLNVDAGGTTLMVASSDFTVGSWNMVTFTWNNTDKKYRVYVDSVLKLTSKAHTHTNAGQWATPLTGYTLGNYSGGTAGGFDSESGFDEWSYWKDTLSQADIDELYNSGNAIAATALSNATAISKLAVYYDWEDSANGTLTNECPTTVNVTTLVTKPTNVQVGSRYEETDTRKMYHYNEKVPKFNYKFDELTGDVINYGSGTNGNLTVTSLTRNVSGTPSGLGNGMNGNGSGQWATSNATYKSDWKFLHDESKWSMTFWLKVLALPPSNDERYVLGNTWTDNAGRGFFVRITGVGSSTTAKLSCGVTNGTTMACNLNSSDGMIPNLTGWHFYCITLDPTLGSNNMKISCDTSETGVKYAEGTETGNGYSSSDPSYKITFLARDSTNNNEKELNADISQVTFWEDKILTQDEKEAIYASGNGTTSMPTEWKEEGT